MLRFLSSCPVDADEHNGHKDAWLSNQGLHSRDFSVRPIGRFIDIVPMFCSTKFAEATKEMVMCSSGCLLRPKWRYQAEEFGRGRTGVRGGRCGDGETREHLRRG